jgi:hypothetical protein
MRRSRPGSDSAIDSGSRSSVTTSRSCCSIAEIWPTPPPSSTRARDGAGARRPARDRERAVRSRVRRGGAGGPRARGHIPARGTGCRRADRGDGDRRPVDRRHRRTGGKRRERRGRRERRPGVRVGTIVEAATLWAGAQTIRRGAHYHLLKADLRRLDREIATAEAAIPEEAWWRAWSEGERLAFGAATARAREALGRAEMPAHERGRIAV